MKLSISLLKTLSIFAADTPVLHYMQGVHVESSLDGYAILVATDGHCLAAIKTQECYTGPDFLITQASIKTLKARPDREIDVSSRVDATLQHVTIADGQTTQTFTDTLSDFPRWRSIIPDKFSCTPAVFDPALLARLCKALGLRLPSLRTNGARAAQIMTEDSNFPGLLALVMPYRPSLPAGDFVKPEWCTR